MGKFRQQAEIDQELDLFRSKNIDTLLLTLADNSEDEKIKRSKPLRD